MRLITLTLNPAFDLHCHVSHFTPYHENLARMTAYDAGGKGVNISRALTSCGVENLAYVVLGDENGDSFRKRLTEDGLSCLFQTVPGRIRENLTVHTNGAPETRISFEGFRLDAVRLGQIADELIPLIEQGTMITYTGRTPSGLTSEDVGAFLLRLKERGARLVIDSKSVSLPELCAWKPWLIKPNEEEMREYLGEELDTVESIAASAKRLHKRGIENVMVSLGERGALLISSEGSFWAAPPPIEACSTIGAGDSSIAGFLAAAQEGGSATECLRRAVAYGTAACLTEGTRPPRAEDVREIVEKVMLRSI